MLKKLLSALLITVSAIGWSTGCGSESASAPDFAQGAFPPVLPNDESHSKSWTRDDCLTCHETGVNDSPKVVHASLPELAKQAKCRTCHVTADG